MCRTNCTYEAAFQFGRRAVGHVVGDSDFVAAALERVGLRDHDALAVAPGQRDSEFFCARRKPEVLGRRREGRKVGRFAATAGGPEPATRDFISAFGRCQQPYRRTVLRLGLRILQQVGAYQRSTLQAHIHVEHVGHDTNRGLGRIDLGRQRRGCWSGVGFCRRSAGVGRQRGELARSGADGRRYGAGGRRRRSGRRCRHGAVVAVPLDDVHPGEQREADPQVKARVIHEKVA